MTIDSKAIFWSLFIYINKIQYIHTHFLSELQKTKGKLEEKSILNGLLQVKGSFAG